MVKNYLRVFSPIQPSMNLAFPFAPKPQTISASPRPTLAVRLHELWLPWMLFLLLWMHRLSEQWFQTKDHSSFYPSLLLSSPFLFLSSASLPAAFFPFLSVGSLSFGNSPIGPGQFRPWFSYSWPPSSIEEQFFRCWGFRSCSCGFRSCRWELWSHLRASRLCFCGFKSHHWDPRCFRPWLSAHCNAPPALLWTFTRYLYQCVTDHNSASGCLYPAQV